MPTPIEILMDPLSWAAIAIYCGLILAEAFLPGASLPKVRGWRFKGFLFFVMFFFLSTYLPLITDQYLANYQWIDLTSWGTWGGALAGLLSYEIVGYFWHRTMHASDFLWRSFHQIHHSSERIDSFSAFYFGPLDMLGWTFVGSVGLVLVVGLTPEAALVDLLAIYFLGIFQHTNIKTPKWLGYVIQRPESHTIHHGRGIHKYNYADLPLIDIIFGTFRNPETFEVATGYYEGASARIVDMLLWKDISRRGDKEPIGNMKLVR